MVKADPREVLRMDAIVGIQVGDQHLAEVVTLLGQHADHPASSPVHSGGLADHDSWLEWILDVIEASEAVAELLLQQGDVLPAGLVSLARDDPDHLQLGRIVGIHDRLHGLLEHVIGLGVSRNHAEMDVLEGIVAALISILDAGGQPVLLHVAAHTVHRAVDAAHDRDGPDEPVDVVDEDHAGDEQRPARMEDDRNPSRRKQEDPGGQTRRRLEQPIAELAHGLLEGRRRPSGWNR